MRLMLDMDATGYSPKNALATSKVYHPEFPPDLVQALYDMRGRQTFYDNVYISPQTYYMDVRWEGAANIYREDFKCRLFF